MLNSFIRPILAATPPRECSWANRGKIIDAGRTNSHCEMTGKNLTKFLRNAEKRLPINALKPKLRYFIRFGTPVCGMKDDRQIAAEF